jgi:hypothetical protein
MFIRRCGWHRRYYGHGKLLGITSWFSRTITFSDGMCDRCVVRAREEWDLPPIVTAVSDSSDPVRRWPAFPFATATVAASVAVVVLGLVTGHSDDASITRRAAVEVPPAGVDTPAATATPRPSVAARAQVDVLPREATPERAEITGSLDAPRNAVRPGARRARIVRVSTRREVDRSSEPHHEIQVSAATSEPRPVLVATAASMMAASPIDPRSLHPFSAPEIVEQQAP